MKRLWQRITNWVKDSSEPAVPLLSDEEGAALEASIAAIQAPVVDVVQPRQPRGRVIRNTKQTEFNPVTTRRGGRVVRAMPKQLLKIKEAQEKVEDE